MISKIFKVTLLPALMMLAGYSCHNSFTAQRDTETLPAPKNIIVFIADGMGYNHLLASNFYEHGAENVQVYEQDDWTRLASSTYNAITEINEGDTVYSTGYNPRSAWSDASYLSKNYTGSAESATAISTGKKTYATAIGIGPQGDTLTHVSQSAKAMGKSIGVVSSVHFNHATPAGFSAHVDSRHDYSSIATYMLFNTRLDLIMAPGNPDYDNNGKPQERNPRYFHSSELWEQLKANDDRIEYNVDGKIFQVEDVNGDGRRDPWTLVESRDDFLALAEGDTPERVLGIPMAYSTINYGRDMAKDETIPFTKPFNENVPSLKEMTRAALNVLDNNKQGFFVMIEGGAVDWASHDNRLGRMIEEQIDFNNSVEAAVEWVEKNSSWDETLVIVTSDHECGYLTGNDHPSVVNAKIVNGGKGKLPIGKWNSDSHTNSLVPFFAKGPGAERFEILADESDPVRGPFIQNSEIAGNIFMLWGKPEIKVHQLN